MDWFYTAKIVFGVAHLLIASPPEYTTKDQCIAHGLDAAFERLGWTNPDRIEITCSTQGVTKTAKTADYVFEIATLKRDAGISKN
ncbi:MAG: hypothetical protein NXI16_08170 [Alphaproteobacteria bacterium]|nr:hypothetical protein [Alphaproteobacteria bacterium]